MQPMKEEEVVLCIQGKTGLTIPNTPIRMGASQSEIGPSTVEETHTNVSDSNIEEIRYLMETISFQTFELQDEMRSIRYRLQAISTAVKHSEFQLFFCKVIDEVKRQFRMSEDFIASLPGRLGKLEIFKCENKTILLLDQLREFSNVFKEVLRHFEHLTTGITASEEKLREEGVVGL